MTHGYFNGDFHGDFMVILWWFNGGLMGSNGDFHGVFHRTL